jgi:general secretion pathway protein D
MINAYTRRLALGVTSLVVFAAATLDTVAQTGGIRPGNTQRTTGGGATGGGGGRTSGAREYNNSTMVGDAMISVDPETRQLIIVTDDETNLQIEQVIKSLDQPKPQVLIKVVFVQVTHNDDSDFGVEGSFTHTSKSGGTTGTAGTDLGLAAAQSLLGGGFYQIASDDFELTVRALQRVGKTEVLSRPSILARNNQQATIIVGQEVPFITNTRFDTAGNQINTVQYQDVGIILRVTPFITSDSLVEMIVTPEISSLNRSTTVTVQDGVEQPVIDKRSADTVVVTPSGRTIVIGGLIETQNNDQVRKVPILGDLPWLGIAFRRTIKVKSKTELLIFLTPFVVQTPGELVKLTEKEGKSMEMAPKSFSEQDLHRYLDGLPVKPDSTTEAPQTIPATSDQPKSNK